MTISQGILCVQCLVAYNHLEHSNTSPSSAIQQKAVLRLRSPRINQSSFRLLRRSTLRVVLLAADLVHSYSRSINHLPKSGSHLGFGSSTCSRRLSAYAAFFLKSRLRTIDTVMHCSLAELHIVAPLAQAICYFLVRQLHNHQTHSQTGQSVAALMTRSDAFSYA